MKASIRCTIEQLTDAGEPTDVSQVTIDVETEKPSLHSSYAEATGSAVGLALAGWVAASKQDFSFCDFAEMLFSSMDDSEFVKRLYYWVHRWQHSGSNVSLDEWMCEKIAKRDVS